MWKAKKAMMMTFGGKFRLENIPKQICSGECWIQALRLASFQHLLVSYFGR